MYSLVLMMALGNGAAAPSFDNEGIRPEATPLANHEHRQDRGRRCHGGGRRCHGCDGGGGCWGGGGGCWGGGYGGCWGGGCHGGGYGSYGGGYYGGYYGTPYVFGNRGYWGDSMYGSGYYGGANMYYGAPYGSNYYYGEQPNAPMPRESGYDRDRFGTGTDRGIQDRGTTPDLGTPSRNPSAPLPAGAPTPNRPGDGSGPPRPPADGSSPPRLEGRAPAPATIVVSLPPDARLFFDGAPTRSTSDSRTFISPPLEPNKDFHYTLKAEVPRDGRTLTASKDITVRAGQETNVVLNPTDGGTTK
jgi:uncharacterized protein (TIGR03000 family)